MKNQCKIDTQKHWKIDAKMAPKIHENRSKNGSGNDLGQLIIDFWAFWSDAKKHIFWLPFWRFKNAKNWTKVRSRGA